MASGRYTAYHVYQGLSFPEAQGAGTKPYTLPDYRCRHSQRGYLFQFDNMVERTHFDAATTTCCNEPVRNFENKPQYLDSSKPMRPRDCRSAAKAVSCTILEAAAESSTAVCAREGAAVSRIKVLCPSLCPEFAGIRGGGSFKGRHGTFRSLGMEAGDIMVMDYTPDAALVSGWYDGCSGSMTMVEEFCGGYTIAFTLNAGLDFPGGCGCDCCGVGGAFLPPSMTLSRPTLSNDWSNTISVAGYIVQGQACSGGQITGSYSGIGGSAGLPWAGQTAYAATRTSRTVKRSLSGTIGSPSNSLCCGALITWSGTDGCGSGDVDTQSISSRIIGSAILPTSGSVFSEGTYPVFSGSGACSYASSAGLSLGSTCLTNNSGQLVRFNGYLTRQLVGALEFSGTHACSGCCGSGAVYLTFHNGCGGAYQASYAVRRALAWNAGSEVIGRRYACESYWRDTPSGGYYYRIARADLYCDGTSGPVSYPFGGYYYTPAECVSGISGAGALNLSGAGGCSNISGGTSCCWYSDNGRQGGDFESRIAVVSAGTCCNIQTSNGSWIFSGAGNPCCPNE